jgi:DNA invertase Pin-like site-specific DNA recombinase
LGGERLDTRNPTSKLMLTILAGVSTWEREIMLVRQHEGIAKAQAAGKYKGRQPTARNQAAEVIRLAADGMKRDDIATQLEITTASAYRILAASKAKRGASSMESDKPPKQLPKMSLEKLYG